MFEKRKNGLSQDIRAYTKSKPNIELTRGNSIPGLQ